jgi:hypothetical protein
MLTGIQGIRLLSLAAEKTGQGLKADSVGNFGGTSGTLALTLVSPKTFFNLRGP